MIIVIHFNTFIYTPQIQPVLLTQGLTFMLPKTSNTEDQTKYCTTACLATLYKLLTSSITCKAQINSESNNRLTEEQKECHLASKQCKDQLTIDSVVMKPAEVVMRNIFTAFKASDSIPHTWLQETLYIYIVHP